ncbi:MAG: nitrilase-related carbon-nitrogen hydrolase, partial [Aggregatilineales bacterium]
MEKLHIALVQGHWTGEQDSTKALYRNLIKEAAATGADLICLPEFSIVPYFPGTRDEAGFQWAESLKDGVSVQFFAELAAEYKVHLAGSIFEQSGEEYYDTATIHNPDGELQYFTRKVHIPSGDGYYETDFFGGYDAYPVHDVRGVNLAAPTCYDQWFPELARIYALNGAEFIFYPTAIGSEPTAPAFDSQPLWQKVMQGHAIANGLFIAAANRIGHENDVTFYGSSFITDPTGTILAQASRDKDEVIHAVLDPTVREQYLSLFPLLHQRRPDTYGRLLEKAS